MELKEILETLKESKVEIITINWKPIFNIKYYNIDNLDKMDFKKMSWTNTKEELIFTYLFNKK